MLLLLEFVLNMYFIIKVYKQYYPWLNFFEWKKEKAIYLSPIYYWRSDFEEWDKPCIFSQSSNDFILSETKDLQGFDRKGIFYRNLYIVRYYNFPKSNYRWKWRKSHSPIQRWRVFKTYQRISWRNKYKYGRKIEAKRSKSYKGKFTLYMIQ